MVPSSRCSGAQRFTLFDRNGIQVAVNPFTQGPVVYVPGYSDQFGTDLRLNMIDTNPASGTFNTIIKTIDAG